MKKNLLLFFSCLFILLSSPYGIISQQQSSVSREIRVDVIVTQNEKFLKDLTRKDFKLFEDGKEVPIASFEFIEKKPGPAGIDSGKRLVVIFHDMSFWEKDVRPKVDELTNELVSLSKQGIEVMILQLNWHEGLQVLENFTSKEELIRKAAEKAIQSVSEDWLYENLWMAKGQEATSGTDRLAIVRAKEGTLLAYLNIERQRFEKAMGGILAACSMVKNLSGRKSILLISNGIPDLSSSSQSNILLGDKTEKETLDAIHGRDQEKIGKIRIFDPFNLMEDKEFNRAEEVIQEVVRFANTGNISLYALDPGVFSRSLISGSSEFFSRDDLQSRTLLEEEKGKQLQNLRLISEETNAVLFRGANKFDQLQLIMDRDLGSYYQLSFIPRKKKADNEYHRIEVTVNRDHADVRFRKGYRDYSEEEASRILLISAYYSPETFKQLPFEAEFLPFCTDTGKYVPWMSIALPTKEFFLERIAALESKTKTFNLNFWLKRMGGEKAFGGRIDLPFKINSALLDYINKRDYFWFFFTGPELDCEQSEYQAVLALVDPQTNEIGAWESFFSLPNLKKSKTYSFMNCVLGAATKNPEKRKEAFSLNKENGSLEYGDIKFYPQVTNRFSRNQESIYVFIQIYDPQGAGQIQPEFLISRKDGLSQMIPGELVAKSWNKKLKVWSGIFRLSFSSVWIGDSIFQVKVPLSEGEAISSKKLRLTKLTY
jgi:VWFA-related protein